MARSSIKQGVRGQHDDSDVNIGGQSLPPFFNTTFSTHRLSPLFIGRQKLDQSRLDHLARRLRETLVGDVVRGIQIGLEATDTPMGQIGPLRDVTFRWFHAGEILGDEEPDHTDDQMWAELSDEQKKGLWIEMRHENAAYVALLLPSFWKRAEQASEFGQYLSSKQSGNPEHAEIDQEQFLRLPLLLLRMPQQLKSIIGEWLSSTFDCRVSKLNLGTKTLVAVWENWIQTVGLPKSSSDLVLTLAFNAPLPRKDQSAKPDFDGDGDEVNTGEPGLRSMDISVAMSDLRRFLRAGDSLQKTATATTQSWDNDQRERRRLAGANADDGWRWRNGADAPAHPFTAALAEYLNHHMALNLFHPSVRITQVACGGFVLAQSKVKIIKSGDVSKELSKAAWMFVMRLGERMRDTGVASVP